MFFLGIMNRREFLRAAGIGAGAILGAASSSFSAGKPKKIIVIGAGLSGLAAAYELKRSGHEVRVLEGQKRPGGRVLTLRLFVDDQYADAGAARIPADHDLTHRYIKEFGLELLPFYPSDGKFSRVRNGRPEPTDWKGFTEATSSVMSLGRRDHWTKIKGGNDLLPKAFAERMRDHISYDTAVKAVETGSEGVKVSFADNGKLQTLRADIVICAIPIKMLAKIDFRPPLSEAKTRVIGASEYASASRVFVQTKERYWQKQGLNGFAFGPRSEEIWDASFGQGTRGLLESYSRDSYSRELSAQSETAAIGSVMGSLDNFFPGVRANRLVGAAKCWSNDPWVMGAWAHLGPSEVLTLIKPEGRIYFAGEHLSFSPSWMQGAIQSGLYTVEQISKLPAS